jgi:hypothetical protein
MLKNNLSKIDGALGAMTTKGQPTHSIYYSIVSDYVNHVNNVKWGV